MRIVRRSSISGKTNEMDLAITQEQIDNYNSGTLLQYAFPQLTPDEREFYKTGITADEWTAVFGSDEDEED